MSDAALNMRDTTIKVSNEQKDEVNSIVTLLGQNATQKDAIDHLLRLNRMKREEEAGRAIPRLDDLRYLFSRFEGIYSEMYLTMYDQEQLSHETIEMRKKEVEELKARSFELNEQLGKVRDEADSRIEEMSQSVQRTIEDKEAEVARIKGEAALVRETADKELEQMRLLVKEAQDSKEQSARLVTLAQEMAESAKQKAETYEGQAQKAGQLQEELQNLRTEMSRMQSEFEKKEDALVRKIEKIESEGELEKNRAVLDNERKMMEQQANLREQVATLREHIAEMKIELERKGREEK